MENRTGIHEFNVKQGDCYDLLGAKTKFRTLCSAVVENVVNKQECWFSVFKNHPDQVDIMSVKNSAGVKLGDFIKEVYYESAYKIAIHKYLLSEFLCYCEIPMVQKDYNSYGYKNSFNKFLVTSNIHVVAKWMGISVEEAEAKYGDRLVNVDDYEDEGSLFPYLKLYETKNHERKVTKPRKLLDLMAGGIKLIPLFALKTGVDVLYNKLLTDTYDVTFAKDSGQMRVINSTFNVDKLREIYSSNTFIQKGIDSWYNGDFVKNPSLERGYVRVFEVGASVYDNPLRSINYARIIGFKKAEPDLAYINIDLDSVLDTFIDGIQSAAYKGTLEVRDFVTALDLFEVGSTRTINNGKDIITIQDLELWASSQYTKLSTVFLRELALFMLGSPEWFSDYTGQPIDSYEGKASAVDLEEDFELDLG